MPKANIAQAVEVGIIEVEVGEQLFVRYVEDELQVPAKSGKIAVGQDGQIVIVGFKGSMYYSHEQWDEYGRGQWLKRQMEYVQQQRKGTPE